MRRSLWALLFLVLGVPIVFAVAGVAWVASLLPPGQGPRVTGPHELVGVDTNGSFAWIVPVADGVVLVDVGLDQQATVLRKEIGGRPVLGVLLTHAHADHTAGLTAFPDAPVWLATADRPYLAGTAEENSPLALAYRKVAGTPTAHGALEEVTDGLEVELGGEVFRATTVPGVTPGSVAWLWRDVLFTGDAVWGGGGLQLPPEALCEDAEDARVQAKRLLALDFATIADGQIGITRTARPALFRLLGESQTPPTVTVRGGPAALDQHTGWLVRAPAPDARGEYPAWLVVPGQPALLLAGAAAGEGWVTIEGRVLPDARFEVRAVKPSITAAPKLPAPDSTKNLEAWTDRWVEVTGTVRSFRPLAPGSAWGEGTLELSNGDLVPLHAPVGVVTDATRSSVLVRVRRSSSGVALVATAPGA